MKLYLIGIFLLMGGCSVFQPEEFVNPIFYKRMTSVIYPEFYAQITPTQVYIHENRKLSRRYPCQLVENQAEKVALKCIVPTAEEPRTFVYTLESSKANEGEYFVSQDIQPHDVYFEKVEYKISDKPLFVPEEKFKNPIFYETLWPVSKIAWQTQLLPTIVEMTRDGDIDISTCKLLENKEDSVLFRCLTYHTQHNSYVTYIRRYRLTECHPTFKYPCSETIQRVVYELLDKRTFRVSGRMTLEIDK